MEELTKPSEARAWVQDARLSGLSTAFVPTMGGLHAGHLRLIEVAKASADRVIVSIFVNPLQFSADEDYGSYPRRLTEDRASLRALECDALFVPNKNALIPQTGTHAFSVLPAAKLSTVMCGRTRPHFFTGVCTIIMKFLNILPVDWMVMGEKDYQQMLIIKRMIQDFSINTRLIAVPIVRDPDGLAMSSRNIYLSATERCQAPLLYQQLCWVVKQAAQTKCFSQLADRIATASTALHNAGFAVDYLECRQERDLDLATSLQRSCRLFAAAWLNQTRLVDNLALPVDRRSPACR